MTHNVSDSQQLTLSGVLPPAPEIIGLLGPARAGKDTICILMALDRPLTRLAFADGVKEEVADAIGMPVSFIEEHKERLRPLLQYWGTELRRDLFDRDYWVKRLLAKLAHVHTGLVVVTDVRFPNEARALAERGARLIRVLRGPANTDSHSSETWVQSAEARALAPDEVVNDGSIETLHIRVQQLFVEKALAV